MPRPGSAVRVPLGVVLLHVTAQPRLTTVGFSLAGSTGTSVFINYDSLPGNLPTTNSNCVAVWQGEGVPWGQQPLTTMTVPGDFTSGSLVVPAPLTANAYAVAYAVGASPTDVCAAAQLGADGQQSGSSEQVSLKLNFVGTTALSVHYDTVSGNSPRTNGNWIGLWPGDVSPFPDATTKQPPPPPLARAVPTNDMPSNDAAFNAIRIARGAEYTLIYFMGESTTTAAAILTFTTVAS